MEAAGGVLCESRFWLDQGRKEVVGHFDRERSVLRPNLVVSDHSLNRPDCQHQKNKVFKHKNSQVALKGTGADSRIARRPILHSLHTNPVISKDHRLGCGTIVGWPGWQLLAAGLAIAHEFDPVLEHRRADRSTLF